MATLELFLLGNPQICVDGRVVTNFNTRKDQALLVYLAVTGTPQSRETLAGLFWSELPEENARRNLRHSLSHLQKVIGAHWIVADRAVALTREQPWSVDVHTVSAAVQKLTASPQGTSAPDQPRLMASVEQLLALYRGEFLQGFHLHQATYFEEWMLAQREALRLLALQGLEVAAQQCLVQGAYEQGLTVTRRLLQLEPWSEPGYRWQMQLLAQNGRRAEALALFEKCRTVLATELGVVPEPATVALYDQIRTQSAARVSPPAPVPAPLTELVPATIASPIYSFPPLFHNLPGQLTPLIGRSSEITKLRTLLLSPHVRLITLVGEGGVGKTRLALAVAQTFVGTAKGVTGQSAAVTSAHPFADGVVFVPLAGLAATADLLDQVAATVAEALRLQFAGKERLFVQLQARLRTQQLLLLFDNVEQLLPQMADFLVELLQNAPELKLIVTSRHLLNLQAEVVIRLAGLRTPAPRDLATLTPTDLLTYSSVALFVERACRVNPTFQIALTNQVALAQICQLVDGLPLAIELAAVQTRQYTCQQILTALQQSYTVLSSSQRDLVPRHRNIRALLDYSWQFLSVEAAQLLAACSSFPSTFDSAAVAAIIGAPPDLLLLLVEQSLLQVLFEDESTGQPRFVIHPLIRQYAAAHLQREPAVVDRLHHAHAHHYLRWLADQRCLFVHDLAALQQIQRESENLRVAWAWASAQGNWELLAASAHALRQFYSLSGLFHEAESTFGRTIAHVRQVWMPEASLPTQQRLVAQLLAHQVRFCVNLDQFAQAEEVGRAALRLGRQLDDPALQSDVFLSLSTLYGHSTDWYAAQYAAEQALIHAQAAAMPHLEVYSLQNIGCSYLYRSELRQALDYLHQALALYHTVAKQPAWRDLHTEGMLCLDLAIAYQSAGELMQAYTYYQQTVAIYRRMNIPNLGVYGLACLSELHLQLGCFVQARLDAEQAWTISRALGSRSAEGTVLGNLAYAHYQLEEWDSADQVCQALFDSIKPLGLTLLRPFAYFIQGELQRQQGQWQAALAAYTIAYQDYTAIEQVARAVSMQAKMAHVWQQAGDLAQAVLLVQAVLPSLSQTIQNSWLETTADYLICYQVLAAAHDPQATIILQQGYHYVQAQTQRITDEALRHSYLENVVANRTLLQLGAVLGGHPGAG